MSDLDDLRAKAETAAKAAPPPYHYQPWSPYPLPSGDYAASCLYDASGEDVASGIADNFGVFAEAADPAVVLALLNHLEAAEEQVRHIRLMHCRTTEATGAPDYCRECEQPYPCMTIRALNREDA